jgi:hypothetical protein
MTATTTVTTMVSRIGETSLKAPGTCFLLLFLDYTNVLLQCILLPNHCDDDGDNKVTKTQRVSRIGETSPRGRYIFLNFFKTILMFYYSVVNYHPTTATMTATTMVRMRIKNWGDKAPRRARYICSKFVVVKFSVLFVI